MHEKYGKLIAENAMLRKRLSKAEAIHPSIPTLNSFISLAPVGILVLDANMRYVHINEYLAQMNGLPLEAHLGKTLKEVVPDLFAKTAETFYKVLNEGTVIHDDFVVGETPKEPGILRTWSVAWFPISGPNGLPLGVGGIVQEITQQLKVETQLLQAQATEKKVLERAASLMENLTEGFCVFDRDFRFVYMNTAGARFIDMSRQELIGRTQWEAFPASVGTTVEREFRRAMVERVTIEFENHYAPWDLWYSIKVYPAENGGLCVLYRDITELKRIADVKHRADELIQRAFDTQSVGIIEWDLDRSLITSASRHFLQMVGYAVEDIDAEKLNFREMTPPEWTTINEDAIVVMRKNGSVAAYEKEYLRKDGTRVPIMIAGVCFENSKTQGVSLVIDLSNVKRAEADLRASEARFRVAAGAVSNIIWTNNAQGMMTGEQDSWKKFTGQDPQSYEGYGWSQCVHPDDVLATIKAWQKSVRDVVEFEFEHRVRRWDGEWRLCTVRAMPVFDIGGTVREWVGVHTDVTMHREAEAQMAASELRYRRLFESAKDGILILEADTATITDANPFISEILGYSLDELLGKELWQIGLFNDVEASKTAMRELQDKGYRRYDDLPLITKGGRQINVEFISNLYGEASEAVIQCNIRDISERRRLEESLRQQAVELLAADKQKNVFLATLAHELRNQLIRRVRNDQVVFDQCLTMMERQLRQMVHLIDDLLDVSRITQGKLDLRKQRIELSTILDSAVESSRPSIEAKGHQLVIVTPPHPVFLNADMTRLAQVFSNLFNNAAKYSDPNGRIEVIAELEGDEICVRVRDFGIGITPKLLTKVFEMFSQLTSSLEKSDGGLGIGLSLVKRLVELHGGSVQAYSEGERRGSEFVVRLPVEKFDITASAYKN
jgi:PAS domain S-box-containing protein